MPTAVSGQAQGQGDGAAVQTKLRPKRSAATVENDRSTWPCVKCGYTWSSYPHLRTYCEGSPFGFSMASPDFFCFRFSPHFHVHCISCQYHWVEGPKT